MKRRMSESGVEYVSTLPNKKKFWDIVPKRINLLLFISLILLCGCQKETEKWYYMLNEGDLSSFTQLNGQAPYRLENGILSGTSVKGQPNSFLATKQLYGDFILEFQVLCDVELNSGVQFRSESRSDYQNGRVHGYQCEIDPSDRAWSGGIYDESRRGWLVTLAENEAGRAAYNKHVWNHYRIEAIGNHITIWLNGVNTANLYDNTTAEGFIAFQVHGIGNDDSKEGKEIHWRNIRVLTENLEANVTKGALIPALNLVPNTLIEEEKANGWKLLFDGETTSGWRGAHKEDFPEKGWKIRDGELIVLPSDGGESTNGGDIVTVDQYSAFELFLEFKLTKGANSGIKYFVTEREKQKGSAFGLEYQLLDDANHPDAQLYTHYPGSRTLAGLYDMIKPENKRFSGVGQWNRATVRVYPNNHVEHWLNGMKNLEYERCSESFRELVSNSKYVNKAYNEGERFGEAAEGHLLLQDHGDEVSFRSIKIRELK